MDSDNDLRNEKPKAPSLPVRTLGSIDVLGGFRQLLQDLESAHATLDAHLLMLPDLLRLASDETRCPDADYRLLVEGVNGSQPLVQAIARRGIGLVGKLNRHIVPLMSVFDDAAQ